MKIKSIFTILCLILIVSVSSCTKKTSENKEVSESQVVEKTEKASKTSKKQPFHNKAYRYLDESGKALEKLEFYGSDLIFTTFGKEPKITYSYDPKTKVLSVTEIRNNETSEYIYNSSKDYFALYEKGQEDDEWILEKYKSFSDKDLDEYKKLKVLLSE